MTRFSKLGFALLMALVSGFSGGAQAATIALGSYSGPSVIGVSQYRDSPFVDDYQFTIGPGVTLQFSAFFSTGFSNRFWILDMGGTLSDSGGVILNGISETVLLPPFPDRRVTFPVMTLGPGSYVLSILGTPTSAYSGITSFYSGSITLAAITPLPGALLFLLTALGAFAWLGRLRQRLAA
ncbi:hypothetical protein [Dongia sedimenti]|uniref:Secreted protein n=1 Tax=Dongia sedimenti TaxID=3064282 RepID=A0ABU0YG04_9PROT|nr:hypothetical protein [Rhodospirillaceae bacterium R-7]